MEQVEQQATVYPRPIHDHGPAARQAMRPWRDVITHHHELGALRKTRKHTRFLGQDYEYADDEEEGKMSEEAEEVHIDFGGAFRDFDMPLVISSDESKEYKQYTDSSDEAHTMLLPQLGRSSSATNKPFPFMRLPAELREKTLRHGNDFVPKRYWPLYLEQ
ncbi:hypothetical protein DOTSEDRAFT_72141 [Dothistroma septosporum NZE10]|uniref:Uncharacterized protein n=1 Tax=Dothistroma septosporum (strain NZE10 / CBS 128990) TaxID=675120 RepID=N1PQD3_DOTSN|nr:hypothetical protein DOTSEDRAFT_72141 [Dothistroma septosporum NZE10]